MRSPRIMKTEATAVCFRRSSPCWRRPGPAGADHAGQRAGRHQPGLDHRRHRWSGLVYEDRTSGGDNTFDGVDSAQQRPYQRQRRNLDPDHRGRTGHGLLLVAGLLRARRRLAGVLYRFHPAGEDFRSAAPEPERLAILLVPGAGRHQCAQVAVCQGFWVHRRHRWTAPGWTGSAMSLRRRRPWSRR